jgi:integrase
MLACCALLALRTGLRKGELLGLRWRDLDLDTRRLTVARSYRSTPKGGKARHLSIPAACLPGLRAWQPECPPTAEGLVFPVVNGGSWSHKAMLGLPKLLQAAGVRVPAHPWHAMRHTFASHFVMQGGSILALQKILGHSDVKMTAIYAHLAPEFLGTEMDRLKF